MPRRGPPVGPAGELPTPVRRGPGEGDLDAGAGRQRAGHVDQGRQAAVEQVRRRVGSTARREVQRVHRQLVRAGVQQGQHWERTDGRAGQQPAHLVGLSAGEERRDPVAAVLHGGDDLGLGGVAVRSHERVVAPVGWRAVVQRAGPGRPDDGVQDRRVVPVTEVDQDVPPAPAGQTRGSGQVGGRRPDHVEEGVPAGDHLAAERAGVELGDADAPGRGDRTYHLVILP